MGCVSGEDGRMKKTIDSHQHVWQLTSHYFNWPTPDLQSIYRDFSPADIEPHLRDAGISGTILVQASPTMDETLDLLELAQHYPFILGVVGWIDMETEAAPDQIAELAANPYFCGIRPMIQTIDDIDWMLKKTIEPSFTVLKRLGLTFDALVFPKHLRNLNVLVERHPDLKIVIDHGAKPHIKDNIFEPWAAEIRMLANHPQVYCKLSGLVTEAGQEWSWEKMLPFVEHLFKCFGYQRIMWGSDYPVLNLVSHYQEWHELCRQYVKKLGSLVEEAVFGANAAEFYLGRQGSGVVA